MKETIASVENIEYGLNNNLNKSIILVDCMDTVIHRNTTLNGIIRRWSKQISKQFDIYDKFLYQYRTGVVSSKMHNIVPIQDIYGEIADHCIYYKLLSAEERKRFIKTSHETELNCEIKSHSLIKRTVAFLHNQKASGKKIYCVSDFRLSSDDIMSFYRVQKIDSLFDGVFSSSDYGSTKKEGTFYSQVLKKLEASAEDCMMIGDNLQSDGINALSNGIKAYILK